MSTGKSAVEKLVFVPDDHDNSRESRCKDDEASALLLSEQTVLKPPHLKTKNALFRDQKITTRGHILIISLAATIFAGRTPLGCPS